MLSLLAVTYAESSTKFRAQSVFSETFAKMFFVNMS